MATRKTTKKKTTKKVVRDTSSGEFAKKTRAATDKAGTMTQTVPIDKDSVRADKGGTHKKRELPTEVTSDPQEPAVDAEINVDTTALEEPNEQVAEAIPALPVDSDAVSDESEGEASKGEETVPEDSEDDSPLTPRKPCLDRRPTKAPDYTCLDEQQEAIEHPERFTEAQRNAIINDDNLCENCREFNESV